MPRILLIDDDNDFGCSLKDELQQHGHAVQYVDRAHEGLERLSHRDLVIDVVLVDNRMPGMTGIDFLGELQQRGIDLPVILMTSQGSSETVMEAMNLGAFDYVEKPLELDVLMDELEPRLHEAVKLRPKQRETTPQSVDLSREKDRLLGNSRPMLELYKEIGRVARSNLPIFIQGETGTGKELVARAIHRHSARSDRPFVALNCTALNESLLHDELFGHEKNAFTGADKMRKGRFEYADSGTLFLDEVGDMPTALQAALLRVLECQEVERQGSNEAIKVDVRIVSATHRDLSVDIKAGRFREDLFFRLTGDTLKIPPLRERGPDLRLLARTFLAEEAALANRAAPMLSEHALCALAEYAWPGNVRELQHVIRRAVQKCSGSEIMPGDLGLSPGARHISDGVDAAEPVAALQQAVQAAWDSSQNELWPLLRDMLERELYVHAWREAERNQTRIAARLGVVRNTVRKRIEEYGLHSDRPDVD